jgi:hypothetical protein
MTGGVIGQDFTCQPELTRGFRNSKNRGLSASDSMPKSACFCGFECHLLDGPKVEMPQVRHDVKGPVIHFAEHLKSDVTLICHRVVSKPTDVHEERFAIGTTEFQILAFAYIFVEDQATSLSGDN